MPSLDERYTPLDLAIAAIFFAKRANQRTDKNKAIKDAEDAQNYATLFSEWVKTMGEWGILCHESDERDTAQEGE